MRKTTKVYGKKSRAISAAEFKFFAGGSSGADSPVKPQAVLSERSNNARLRRSRLALPDGEEAIIEVGLATRDIEEKIQSRCLSTQNTNATPTRQRRTTVRRDGRASSPKPHTSLADLSAVLENLQLNSSPEVSLLASKASEVNSEARPISPCPADISSEVLNYLSPILNCKNVSQIVSDFSLWLSYRSHLTLEKIGEGSFGEVFRASSTGGTTVLLKLMPLNAAKRKGSRSFTSITSAANEIRLLERMQRVPGFVEFRGACVLRGNMPSEMVQIWNAYRDSGRTVESRDPNRKNTYSLDQLWLLLEMSDAGRNLEPGQYAPPGKKAVKGTRYLSVVRTWDIFWQTVKAVAKAEIYAQFEHRDLHLGNVCARDTRDAEDSEELRLIAKGEPLRIGLNTTGVEITIIDYSLSRATMLGDEEVLSYDFQKDKHLLKGEGDLQYDIYRYMDTLVGKRTSQDFVPQTNILWLWYLLERLLSMTVELSTKAKKSKANEVTTAARMTGIFEDIQQKMDPKEMGNWTLHSAGALLDLGIEERWFESDDVIDA